MWRTGLAAAAAMSALAVACIPPTPPPPTTTTTTTTSTTTTTTTSTTSTTVPSCTIGVDCPQVTTSGSGAAVEADFGPGVSAANLSISIDPPDAPAFECPGFPKPSGTPITEFHFTDGTGASRLGLFTVTVADVGQPFGVCWAAPYVFPVLGGGLPDIQGTKPSTSDPLYVGRLRYCDGNNWPVGATPVPPIGSPAEPDPTEWTTEAPCVFNIIYNFSNETITTVVLTTGADPWRY